MQSSSDQQPDVNVSVYATVDAITRMAEASGWPTEQAFHVAMLLTIDGVTVSEAQRLLADSGRAQ